MCFSARRYPWLLLAFLALGAVTFSLSLAEVADCIAALVGNEVITLSDIRLLDAFGIYDEDVAGRPEPRPLAILKTLIDRKVVIGLTRERMSVPEERLNGAREELTLRLGSGRLESLLTLFHISAEDLKPYLAERLLYQDIIAIRFSRSAIVTLKEIEDYYQETYVPAQRAEGAEPEPLLKVLADIEAVLRKEKVEKQVDSWVQNLKKQAGIRVNDNCLKYLTER